MYDPKMKKVPIHQALTQPILLAGAERELTILVSFMAAIVWVAGKDILSLVIAVIVWVVGNSLCRMAAKGEAQRTRIFSRHVRYKEFYPATEKLGAPMPEVKTFKC